MIKVIFILLFSFSICAQEIIGEVLILKGSASLVNEKGEKLKDLKEKDSISLSDTISVAEKSFLRLKMIDKSLLSFGGNSEVKLEKYIVEDKKRVSILSLVRGKIRAEIEKIEGEDIPDEDKIYQINTQSVSIGVRGTEFLVNSYLVSKKPVADTVLLSGKVNAQVVGSKAVNLIPGQAINSSEFLARGKIRTISQKSIAKLIANKEAFLPNIQLPDGNFIDLDKKLKDIKKPSLDTTKEAAKETASKETVAKEGATSSTTKSTAASTATKTAPASVAGDVSVAPSAISTPGIPSVPSIPGAPSIPSAPSIPAIPKEIVPLQVAKPIVAKEVIKYISDTPWDIKDARTQRKDRKKVNECFYWVYRKIPHQEVYQRFREEKDCDDFEFDF
jgi:hypothetical protein